MRRSTRGRADPPAHTHTHPIALWCHVSEINEMFIELQAAEALIKVTWDGEPTLAPSDPYIKPSQSDGFIYRL